MANVAKSGLRIIGDVSMIANVYYSNLSFEELQDIRGWLSRDPFQCSTWILSRMGVSWKKSFSVDLADIPDLMARFGTAGPLTIGPSSLLQGLDDTMCDCITGLMNGRMDEVSKNISPCPDGRDSFMLLEGDVIEIVRDEGSTYHILFGYWTRLVPKG